LAEYNIRDIMVGVYLDLGAKSGKFNLWM